jgi:hypothetical protein
VGLRSWLFGDTPKPVPSADETACGLSQAVLYWCSPEQIAATRVSLHIPADARNFETELLYLYAFLTLVSLEVSYRDNEKYRADLTKAFIDHINEAIASGDVLAFHASSDTMRQRYAQYLELHERGAAELIERLPFTFLVSNGVCRSDSAEDMRTVGMPLTSMQVWVGEMLTALLSANEQWRKQHGV